MANLFRIVIGLAMGTLPERGYVSPKVTGSYEDQNGWTVFEVRASNYVHAARFRDGLTSPGDVSKASVRVGCDKWELRVEDWDITTCGYMGEE